MRTVQVTIRRLSDEDSLDDLTGLIHRAYKTMADQGHNATGSYQTVETTRLRCSEGTCFVAEADGKLVGTAMLVTRMEHTKPELYCDSGLAVLGQFGVDP